MPSTLFNRVVVASGRLPYPTGLTLLNGVLGVLNNVLKPYLLCR